MLLFMDEHVPSAITRGLRLRGVDVLTTQEDGSAGLKDPELLDCATAMGRIIYTEDQDFLVEALMRQEKGNKFAGVLYYHQLALSIGQRVRELELIASCVEPDEVANRVVHLPLR